jgi:N6-adenosine-specific RNA methylase IME4
MRLTRTGGVADPNRMSVVERLPYRVAALDPPWPENGGGKIKRGADRHYATMPVKQIPACIIGSGHWTLAENAHVYLWVTNNYLPAGLWVLEQLAIRYVTTVTWPKERTGIGQYFRGKTEHILFGVKGRGMDPSVFQDNRSLSTLLENAEHARIHSRKPAAAFDLIEARSKGPYCEFFCDHELPARPGWDRWGLPRSSVEERT